MKLLLAFLLAGAATPALAQHAGHGPPAAAIDPACPPEHAAMGHCTPRPSSPTRPATPTPPANPQADPHAGQAAPVSDPHAAHSMPAPAQSDPHGHPAPATDPHAGHVMPAPAQTDPHAGHDMQRSADPHAGHNMGASAPLPGAPQQPPPAEAFSGPEHAADAIFGQAEMSEARSDLNREHGGLRATRFLFDRLEVGFGEGRGTFSWDDAQFWYGGDIEKLWVKSEGEGEFGGGLESAEVQALYSRAIDPWFDLQAGVRYDHRPDGPDRGYLVLGVQGLAPYWFEIDAAAFLSNKGDLTARFEAEYDQKITQALVLQPAIELDFALQDVPELGVGSGLSTAELGLRLRYDIYPERGPAVIAPYVGVEYERSFGDTARFARAQGEEAGDWRFLVGLRTWF